MRRLVELLLDPTESPFVWFAGMALVLGAIFGGINAIQEPTWREQCIEAGGTYVFETTEGERSDVLWTDDEKCEMP